MNQHIDTTKPPSEQKIKFIKWVRTSYPGMGLKSAKDVCERFIDDAYNTHRRDMVERKAEFDRRKIELARQFIEEADLVSAAAVLDCVLPEETWKPWPEEFMDLQVKYQQEHVATSWAPDNPCETYVSQVGKKKPYTMALKLVDDEGKPLWKPLVDDPSIEALAEVVENAAKSVDPDDIVAYPMDPELERLLNEEAEIAKDDTNPGHPSTGLEGE